MSGRANHEDAIAIIGASGRFSAAATLEALWCLLERGGNAAVRHDRDALLRAGEDAALIDLPRYVPVSMELDGIDCFDAAFFGFSERQARLFDPQNRLLLETAWHALEDAGHAPAAVGKTCRVGVFAGKNPPQYLLDNLGDVYRDVLRSGDVSRQLELLTANDKDYLANWIAYKLGLSGPVLNIQTACSTGLAVVAAACQSLLSYQCDMALAGAAGLNLSRGRGYLHQPDSILCADGVCRPFDAEAAGTLNGNGVAAVVLKRYEDAVEDGDRIDALILGAGLSNDADLKQDFMAPGIDGQAQAIRAALRQAGVGPDDIDYVEAHGTGTRLGDPVEIMALGQAFGSGRNRAEPCLLGSIKGNLGHLNACAGLAGLLKVVLSLRHEALPPQANFTRLNPHIKLDDGRFAVNERLRAWPRRADRPRRAGISSFGFGGSNVHMVLEEAPAPKMPPAAPRSHELVFFSAASERQLQRLGASWAEALADRPAADAAYVSLAGRGHFDVRAVRVVGRGERGGEAFADLRPQAVVADPRCCWMFTGQGVKALGMGRQLAVRYPAFRDAIAECRAALGRETADDVWPERENGAGLQRPSVLQPALFMMQYALSRLWRSVGMAPDCVAGHSLGEIAAACVAGALSAGQGVVLARLRGEAVEAVPSGKGGMLAVVAAAQAMPVLPADLAIAAYNADDLTVVAGPTASVEAFAQECRRDGVATMPLAVSHAFHTPMMAEAAACLARNLDALPARAPAVPMFSSVTGARLEDAPDREYWLRHLLAPTLFAQSLHAAVETRRVTLALEIGPQALLSAVAKRAGVRTVASCVSADSEGSDWLHALGALYVHGLTPDPAGLFPQGGPRLSLPGYPFERKSFWVEAAPAIRYPAADAPVASACRAPEAVGEGGPDEPGDELLQLLTEYWRTYLGSTDIATDDDFFALGGNSLAAMQIREAIHRDLGTSIEMETFMTVRTLAQLRALVAERVMEEEAHA